MSTGAPFGEAVLIAIASLRSSKLRSFLTLLGIILATTTLIAVMSVIHGMDVYIATPISNMGADGFRVVRLAMIGDFDPKKYLEMMRRNPELSGRGVRVHQDQGHAAAGNRHGADPQRPGPLRRQSHRDRAPCAA